MKTRKPFVIAGGVIAAILVFGAVRGAIIAKDKPETTTATTTAAITTTTAEITTTATEATTVTTTDAEVEQVLKLTQAAGSVAQNSTATLSVQGKPDTKYTIEVFYSSKVSEAKGLEPATSDSNGYVAWSWKIGGRTEKGEYRIVVSGGGEKLETVITVTD